ncbi:MAG: hypothetical protein PHG19_12150 [Anaerotignum sp.]|nr:hypothetical protein [Anaerotignum sp.]
MEPQMTSFGIPITAIIEGGTLEDLKKSISEKLSKCSIDDFPSVKRKLMEKSKNNESERTSFI